MRADRPADAEKPGKIEEDAATVGQAEDDEVGEDVAESGGEAASPMEAAVPAPTPSLPAAMDPSLVPASEGSPSGEIADGAPKVEGDADAQAATQAAALVAPAETGAGQMSEKPGHETGTARAVEVMEAAGRPVPGGLAAAAEKQADKTASPAGEEAADPFAKLAEGADPKAAREPGKPEALAAKAAPSVPEPKVEAPPLPSPQPGPQAAPGIREANAAAPGVQSQPQGPVLHQVPLGVVPIEIGLKSLAGINQFQIRLDPAELGRIDVRLDINDEGEVKAQLVVDRVETLNLLQRDAKTLERAFEQAGLKPSEGGVDLSLRDPSADSRQHPGRGDNGGDNGSDNRDDRRGNRDDRTVEADRGDPAPKQRMTWRGIGGVDVRI